jgi:hypothetical protein
MYPKVALVEETKIANNTGIHYASEQDTRKLAENC